MIRKSLPQAVALTNGILAISVALGGEVQRARSLVKKVVGDEAMGVISMLIRSVTLASMLRLVRMRVCVWILDAEAVVISVPAWGSTWLMFMKL
jgi:hypothetical protein